MTTQATPTEFQNLVEEFRESNFHLSNMISLLHDRSADEDLSLCAAARHYLNEQHQQYEGLLALANAQAEKGSA